MLTADLVRAYRRGASLKLGQLDGAHRARAIELAAAYIGIAKGCVGRRRGDLHEELAAVPVQARDQKVAAGLRKLIEDRCELEVPDGPDPVALRRAVFGLATRRRRDEDKRFDRDAVLGEVAQEHGLDAAAMETLLYTDLRSEHLVLRFAALDPALLVEEYISGQAQAVLLRASRVVARVYSATPGAYRALFRKLKFLRLLPVIEALPGDTGYEITIDGPYSLFRSVTKYGLKLAMMLPALEGCERWSLWARVHWGKSRQALDFTLESKPGATAGTDDHAALPDEAAALLQSFDERFAAGKTAWQAEVAAELLPLPGVGICVPDLLFTHRDRGARVFLEVLGFWSRNAVWQRVELVEKGLSRPMVFAVSSRLRVSEAALDPNLPGALYVYKGAMSARAIEERLDQLATRLENHIATPGT